MNRTGGPAFPCDLTAYDEEVVKNFQGMTLRDYFAGQAMNALILERADWKYAPETLAKYAYAQADAMLKARDL